MKKFTLLFVLSQLFNLYVAKAAITFTNSEIILENDQIKKVISYSKGKPHILQPISIFYKKLSKEILSNEPYAAWFEFSVQNQIVSSLNPVWQYEKHDLRKMANGGEEVNINFIGKKAPVKGLRVTIIQQIFPGSSIIREQLTIQATQGSSFKLTFQKGKPHFIFPLYHLQVADEVLNTTELRMATWSGELVENNASFQYDERKDGRGERNLSQNYMYHPKRANSLIDNSESKSRKGPIVITTNPQGKIGWLMLYEHGSPDDDPDQNYLSITQQRLAQGVRMCLEVNDGAYFADELITSEKKFSSVWASYGIFNNSDAITGEQLVHDYLYKNICELGASRKPSYYYNTWGMQRAFQKPGEIEPRSILTTAKILEEIGVSSELGIDLFVLDDGWQNEFGNWTPHNTRLNGTLQLIADKLAQEKISFGIWMAPMFVDELASLNLEHPEWRSLDEKMNPIIGLWKKQTFCIVSDYQKYFIQSCKKLIDQGVRFFKWDGFSKFLCNAPGHHHGTESQSPEERRKRYGYEFPLYVTKALYELKKYNPEIVVEVDITEPGRSVGLSFLSEGKYFWMNNGASEYGDYSTYRAKSTRVIPYLFHSFMPGELQTYAAYPHNSSPYLAQRYNVNSAMISGKGFWGNLYTMSPAQRAKVKSYVENYRKVDSFNEGVRTEVIGLPGDSPEIYTKVSKENAAGWIIGFSGSALKYDYTMAINSSNLLAVIQSAYTIKNDTLNIPFLFPMSDTSREALLLTNGGSGISLLSSSSWLNDAKITGNNQLEFSAGAPGKHLLNWPLKMDKPIIEPFEDIKYEIKENGESYLITIETLKENVNVVVLGK